MACSGLTLPPDFRFCDHESIAGRLRIIPIIPRRRILAGIGEK
jgi:hypothetical protein